MADHDLPEDIIFEILSRIPAKSLLRLQCVCNNWRSLFATPSFIQSHLNHTTLNPKNVDIDDEDETLILHSREATTNRDILSLLPLKNPCRTTFNLEQHPVSHYHHMEIVGSIHGLVCLLYGSSVFVLWNPATREHKKLPQPIIYQDPVKGSSSVGFCFDTVRNDYKIVRTVWLNQEPLDQEQSIPHRVELYSAAADSWREIGVEVPVVFLEAKCSAIVKGKPYWLGYIGYILAEIAVSFDVDTEVFRQVPLVRLLGIPKPPTAIFLVTFNNSLAALSSSSFDQLGLCCNGLEEIYLWSVDDGSCWSKKLTAGPFYGMNRVVGCSNNGHIMMEMKGRILILYSFKTQKSGNIWIDGAAVTVHNYTPSLVPIRGSKQVGKEAIGDINRIEETDMGSKKQDGES